MKLYVIGPVTGLEDRNRAAFEDAAEALESVGFDAYIPHWFVPEDASWRKAMKLSVESLVKCDGVAMLEGSGKSKGARAEADLASGIGMPVKSVEGWLRAAVGGGKGGRG